MGFAGEWAGLNCIDSLTEDRLPTYPWVNETQLCLDGQTKAGAKEIAHYTESLPVHLSPLPCWADLEADKRRQMAKAAVATAQKSALEARGGLSALGMKRVLKQDPLAPPKSSKKSRRPLCHTSSKELWKEFRTVYRSFVAQFREASQLFREGDFTIEFPPYSYPPPRPFVL